MERYWSMTLTDSAFFHTQKEAVTAGSGVCEIARPKF
jgi:hypothetical protein